jgi:hypothetical protein
MPVLYSQYSKTGRAMLRCTASETFVVVGNNSTSNVASNNAAETVLGATITQFHYNAANNITIARGANTILVLTGENSVNLETNGLVLNESPAANIVITINGTGSIILEVHKQSTLATADML